MSFLQKHPNTSVIFSFQVKEHFLIRLPTSVFSQDTGLSGCLIEHQLNLFLYTNLEIRTQTQFMTNVLFSELPLSEEVQMAVAEMGFVTASPIQAEAIPYVLQGHDVIGQAQTGTGKTAAFGIPIVEAVEPFSKSVQAIVLCPTRELACQVADEIKKLAKFKKGVFVATVYGGDSIERQIKALKSGANVVVGTPGRVIDHIERRTLKLENVKIAVLDEADEMLDMGFRDDIESILQETPAEKQTVFFSATMAKEIMNLTKKYQKDPKIVKVTKNEVTNTNIEQFYFDVRSKAKMEVMCRLIDFHQIKLALVFSNQKRIVDEIVEDLQARGYQAEGLHGDMRQQSRSQVMNKFKSGATNILVATDVAARGIDVENVDAVINYDLPLDSEYYVHRIGRTGRAGKSGKSFSLVVGSERNRLRDITNYTKKQIDKGTIPTFADIVDVKKQMFIERVQKAVTEGELNLFEDTLAKLQETGLSTEQIVAALVKMNMGVTKNEFSDTNLDGDSERRERRSTYGERPERSGGYGSRDGGRDFGNRGGGERREYGNRSEGGSRPDGNRFGNRPDGNRSEGTGGRFERAGASAGAPRYEDRPARVDRDGTAFRRGPEQDMVRCDQC